MIYNSRYVPRTAVCCRHNCGGSGSTNDHLCSQYTFQTEIYRALSPVVGRMDGRTDGRAESAIMIYKSSSHRRPFCQTSRR